MHISILTTKHKLCAGAVPTCCNTCRCMRCCRPSPIDGMYRCMWCQWCTLIIRTTTNAVCVHQLAVDEDWNMCWCMPSVRCKRAGTCPSPLTIWQAVDVDRMCTRACPVADAGAPALAFHPSITIHRMYHDMTQLSTILVVRLQQQWTEWNNSGDGINPHTPISRAPDPLQLSTSRDWAGRCHPHRRTHPRTYPIHPPTTHKPTMCNRTAVQYISTAVQRRHRPTNHPPTMYNSTVVRIYMLLERLVMSRSACLLRKDCSSPLQNVLPRPFHGRFSGPCRRTKR